MMLLNIKKYIFVFLVGFLVTLVVTAWVKRIAPRLGWMDIPDERRVHKSPTPRAGGIAVFLGFHAACAAIYLMPWSSFAGQLRASWWWHFLILSFILLVIGLVDDRKGIRPFVKLSGQIVVAVLAFAMDMQVGKILGFHLPPVLNLILTIVWFVAVINAFNLIDGIDGLASGLAIIAAFGLAGALAFRHLPGDTLVALALAASCLAFLRYNFHPATIFLGDSGSMFLGFTIAAIALATGSKDAAVATIVVPLLAVGVPVFDAGLAVWRRSARSLLQATDGATDSVHSRLFTADLDHIHHRLGRRGLSQPKIVTVLYMVGIALVAVGLLGMVFESHAIGIYILAFVGGTYVTVRHLARVELWDSGKILARGVHRPPNRVL
ncbi:MAG: MraY family glycosyltransferase, partial [Verrucomicrobia bacterium]|nr:MraY family glycosyltransferase [Verrucomicrobiota bacterium]